MKWHPIQQLKKRNRWENGSPPLDASKEEMDDYYNSIFPYPKKLRLGVEKYDDSTYLLTIFGTEMITNVEILITMTNIENIEIIKRDIEPYLTIPTHRGYDGLLELMLRRYGYRTRRVIFRHESGRFFTEELVTEEIHRETVNIIGVCVPMSQNALMDNKQQLKDAYKNLLMTIPDIGADWSLDTKHLKVERVEGKGWSVIVNLRHTRTHTVPQQFKSREELNDFAKWEFVKAVDQNPFINKNTEYYTYEVKGNSTL